MAWNNCFILPHDFVGQELKKSLAGWFALIHMVPVMENETIGSIFKMAVSPTRVVPDCFLASLSLLQGLSVWVGLLTEW